MKNKEEDDMCEKCGKYHSKTLIDETHYVCNICKNQLIESKIKNGKHRKLRGRRAKRNY